jgi:selenocysteine lyase/cysteine desulfurase
MGSAAPLDISAIRASFPALAQKQVFMDNAGGSQVLGTVIDSIATYLRTTNVQLGASYPVSQQSTSKFGVGHEAGAKYINARPDQVVFGPSTTQHFRNVSTALTTREGDEIVISKLDHEANVAGWLQMAKWRGLKVVWWHPRSLGESAGNPMLVVEDLRELVNERTRLVACTHTSNILGTVTDLRALSEVVHGANERALFAADAVAYAPHARVDVREFGVDFYSFSW